MEIKEIYPRNSRILLVGPTPPPLGGVAVHIGRLKKILEKSRIQNDSFFTYKKYRSKILNSIILLKLILFNSYNVIHVHGYFRAYILTIYLCSFLKKCSIYYTEHNSRLFENRNKISIYFFRCFIKRVNCLIVVAEHIFENFRNHDIHLPEKSHILNAFLPPPEEEEKRICKTYSPETKKFIKRVKPLIIANAWKIVFFKNIDLYGLDLCIELTCRLKKDFPQIGFLFALANKEYNSDYIAKMEEQINERSVKDNFHIMTGQKELWPLFKKANLSVRPTVTDGDAISIRESIYFDCPVIASNVAPRPKETILFKSRDIEDLFSKVMKTLHIKMNPN